MALFSWVDRTHSRYCSEEAQTMAEYAVVLAVITPAIIVALGLMSGSITNLISNVVGFF